MTRDASMHRLTTCVLSTALVALTLIATSAQTKIVAPKNSYSLQDDVKLGADAAAEARRELPMLNDDNVDKYIEGIGARLVAAIPPEFQHPEFKFTFDVINQKEINAFALPGGPMFLNRGMMEAAKTEAEMVGVMGHEISHVALRHGTAQQGKTTLPGLVGVLGQIAGGALGGLGGAAVSTVAQVGSGAWALKYSREFESQADILGAQILARAGYDPREMANMFKTIEAEGGGGGPQWLSSHPNPGNRFNAITKEADLLQIQGKADSSQFAGIQARLKEMGPSYTAEQIAKGQAKTTGNSPAPAARTVTVEPPSSQYRTESPASFLQFSVPANWTQAKSNTYTPSGAFFETQGGATSFTHGIQFGTAKGTGNLQRDTQALLNSFARGNPQLRQQSAPKNDRLSGRAALTTTLSNVSDVTGQPEQIAMTTTMLPNNTLFFVIGVAPQSEAAEYSSAFQRVRQSVRITTR